MQWLAQICEAVAAAHQVGVVHGDLTPNNILLNAQGRIVITDFGFATHSHMLRIDPVASESIVSPGGTLGYAAPEQLSSAFGTISFATDIYAIGGIAFYLLTGCSPHHESLVFDTVNDANVHLPNSNCTQSEAKLVAIAKLALKKAVNCRPKSVAEVIALLSN